MSAAADAIDNMTKAGAMPCVAPSGTATCPEGRIRIGVFFDGTNNNQWRDWPNGIADSRTPDKDDNGPTNVAKLWYLYREIGDIQKRVYHHGVGTDSHGITGMDRAGPNRQATDSAGNPDAGTEDTAYDWRGNGFGAGGKARTTWGLKHLSEFFSKNTNPLAKEKLVEVYGFSRGAAISRDFINRVLLEGIDNLKDKSGFRYITVPGGGRMGGGYGGGQQTVRVPAFQRHKDVIIHFLGAFDTVASFGLGGLQSGDSLAGYNLFIDHTKVKHTVHMIAEDEIRGNFPVTSLFMDPKNQSSQDRYQFQSTMIEIWYPGVHCDIGGAYLYVPMVPAVPARTGYTTSGYGHVQSYTIPAKPAVPAKGREMSHIPLEDMHKASVDQGVPLKDLTVLPENLRNVPENLRSAYNHYNSYRAGTDFNIGRRYIQNFASSDYHARFYVQRAAQPSVVNLQTFYIHDSRWGIDKLYNREQRTVLFMGPQPTEG